MTYTSAKPKAVTAFDNPFKGLKPETEQTERRLSLKESNSIEFMFRLWKKHQLECKYNGIWDKTGFYSRLSADLKGIEYGATEVKKFCSHLTVLRQEYKHEYKFFFDKKAGLFLSTLINHGKDEEYTLPLRHLERGLDNLGYLNKRSIVIEGNVGDDFAELMESGKIEIFGDAGETGNFMNGGTIRIHGGAKHIGRGMEGGTITIDGSITQGTDFATMQVGRCMKDGEISVKGDVHGNVGEKMRNGNIWIGGSVFGEVAYKMHAGKIIIEGNIYGDIARTYNDMGNDGQIHVNGPIISLEIGSIEQMAFFADIYHNEKLIASKGHRFNCYERILANWWKQ
jgi:formylmethanofuran dehydrogenase subunit C